jgi:hypothetical protein
MYRIVGQLKHPPGLIAVMKLFKPYFLLFSFLFIFVIYTVYMVLRQASPLPRNRVARPSPYYIVYECQAFPQQMNNAARPFLTKRGFSRMKRFFGVITKEYYSAG